MNNINEIDRLIRRLITDTEITSYKLSKETGIPYNNIHRLRNGQREVDNLSFDTIKKLYKFANDIYGDSSK